MVPEIGLPAGEAGFQGRPEPLSALSAAWSKGLEVDMIFGGYNETQWSGTTVTTWRIWQRGTIHTGGNVTASGTMYYDNYGASHGYHEPYATTPQTALNEEHARLHRRYGEKVREFLDRLARRRVFDYWGVPLRYLFEHAAWEPEPPSHHVVTMRTRGRTRGPRRGRIVRSYFTQKHRSGKVRP